MAALHCICFRNYNFSDIIYDRIGIYNAAYNCHDRYFLMTNVFCKHA